MQRHRTPEPGPRGASSQNPRRPPQTSAKSPARRVSRRSSAATTSAPGGIELTRAQQIEAKAARDAVVGAMTKSSPQTAKMFVESISLDVDVETTRQLLCSKKGFVALPSSIGVLCRQLRRLDLSGNDLTDLSPLATLQHLSNLNVAHNGLLASLKGLSGTCLSVLNISFCAVESLEGLEHTALTLRTFIANDNRLQLHSPLLADVVATAGEDAAEMEAAREHLPESLRRSSSHSDADLRAVAQRNYAIFSTFQQCETVVLSRNTRLCQLFPTWGVEEVAAECGEVPGRSSAAADDEGSDDAVDGASTIMSADGDGGDSASRGKKRRASAAKRRNHRGIAVHPTDRSASNTPAAAREPFGDSPEMAAYNQRRHALALAHPLSVFERLSRLRKLSLSGCELHSLPVRWFLPVVTELRLAQNHLTSLQPDGVILRSLHILDISNNLFASVASLRRCRYLEQLNVRGNPLIEEGALQDKVAGLTTAERIADAAATTPSSGTSAVPIAVQQCLLRLFPNMKLLDGQPMMTAGQVRAAYMQRNARSAAERQDKLTEKGRSDGSAIVASSHEARDDVGDAHAASDDSERGSSSGDAPRTAPTVRAEARSPARKARRADSAVIAAEADEKDVVVEAPLSVVKTAHAPIVRRERVLLRPGAAAASGSNAGAAGQKRKAGQTPTSPAAVVYGQAAVAKLLEQSRSRSGQEHAVSSSADEAAVAATAARYNDRKGARPPFLPLLHLRLLPFLTSICWRAVMFEEALRQAPREELVEHIRLQRELIHRLHRRVLELESSLENVYACSSDGGGAAGAGGQSAAPSERQRAVLSSNLRHGPPPPTVQQSVHGASGGAPPAKVRTYPLATFCEAPLGFSERWSTDNDEAAAAPEPRCRPPRPHVEEKAPVAFARLSSSLQRQTGERAAMAPSASGTDTAPTPFSAAAISTGLTSSSVDHPTVLEGIKEINYVLAAHRAGRPALPLSVVEELEDIRTRLLQGFNQTHSMGDRDDGTAQEAVTARRAYGALPRGEEMVLNSGSPDLLFERCADTFPPATHVCPRWVSPDSSRVVYGTSPRRHQ